eukprot:8603619-Pyramimonas_sp.AAC.1
MREQRALQKKLTSVKTLGDSDDEENEGGAAAWVSKSRTKEQKRKEEVYIWSSQNAYTVPLYMRKRSNLDFDMFP